MQRSINLVSSNVKFKAIYAFVTIEEHVEWVKVSIFFTAQSSPAKVGYLKYLLLDYPCGCRWPKKLTTQHKLGQAPLTMVSNKHGIVPCWHGMIQ